jgi:hypothetical protein
MAAHSTPLDASAGFPRFIHPTAAEMSAAEQIVDSDPVIRAYTASEWDELNHDGRVWIAAIVREASARALKQPRFVPGHLIADINAFLIHMAKHFRRRTSRLVLGMRINTMSRTQAMAHALATYDATLDMIGAPFGHPDHAWDRAAAHEFVDVELQHWEG